MYMGMILTDNIKNMLNLCTPHVYGDDSVFPDLSVTGCLVLPMYMGMILWKQF